MLLVKIYLTLKILQHNQKQTKSFVRSTFYSFFYYNVVLKESWQTYFKCDICCRTPIFIYYLFGFRIDYNYSYLILFKLFYNIIKTKVEMKVYCNFTNNSFGFANKTFRIDWLVVYSQRLIAVLRSLMYWKLGRRFSFLRSWVNKLFYFKFITTYNLPCLLSCYNLNLILFIIWPYICTLTF